MPLESGWKDAVVHAALVDLWENRVAEGFANWLGYGSCCFKKKHYKCGETGTPEPGGSELVLLTQREYDTSAFMQSLARRIKYHLELPRDNQATESTEYAKSRMFWGSNVSVESVTEKLTCLKKPCKITVGALRQFETGLSVRPSTLLRPGARVFSTSPRIGDSPNGTIGAFLTRNPKRITNKKGESHPRPEAWLLSNKHVLLQRTQDLESVEVRGAGQTLISRDVTYIGERFEGNMVDAAVARINPDDIDDIEPFYEGTGLVCPCPVEPRPGMEVKKIGNATGVTKGTVICQLDHVAVGGSRKGGGGEDFIKPWLIGSDDTFVANGDSGALVIGCGHPVALLFALADNADLPQDPTDPNPFIPPYGLAVSICDVLVHIEEELGFVNDQLEIMLCPKRKDACLYPQLHDPRCCPPEPKCPEQHPPTLDEDEEEENPAPQQKQEHKPHK